MKAIVGSGKHTYKVHEDWARAPEGVDMKPAAVAVGPQDRVYCFNRVAEHPVVVFDRDGNFPPAVHEVHRGWETVADHRGEGRAFGHRRAGR
jgi:hypothetical protein